MKRHDDDSLKQLFSDFNPDRSSDMLFMEQLESKLDAVEIVKQSNAAAFARSRRAVKVAACVGVLVGIAAAVIVPYLAAIIGEFLSSSAWASTGIFASLRTYPLIPACIIAGGAVAVITKNAYDFSMAYSAHQEG